MVNGRRVNPVHRSISRPLTILGAERKLFFFAMCICASTFNLLGSLLSGVLMFLLLCFVVRWLLTLSKRGHRFLTTTQTTPKAQAIHYGFTKPREAHHDADLYRMYSAAAEKIEAQGGRNLRVILDYELKKRLYHDLTQLGPDRESAAKKKEIAEKHGLQLVRGKIPLPDLRIEYETRDGEMARVDLELATEHYRGRNLDQKVRAGFSIYAQAQDTAGLRRVLDQRELTAEILSL